ncbi:MAG: hypothetical protein KAS38_13920 [Anaerolineales bacterium]|nr:hypothetical protein [Anaerolineales bacterium]
MTNSQQFIPVAKFILVAAGLVIVITGLKYSAEMFIILFLALIFAVILTPLKNWFERIRESFSP